MKDYKVSVIIPVYKSEKFLRDCVGSVTEQSLSDVQIILVDDESPDSCPAMCDEYGAAHENITVLHKKNGGVGSARNTGMRAARGRYVMFLDSDDLLDGADALERLWSEAERENADITVGNYRYLRKKGPGGVRRLGLSAEDDRASPYFRFRGFYGAGHMSYAWAKLYRRTFLQDNNIESPVYRFTQDKMFNFRCYSCGARYAFVEQSVCLYRVNAESVTFGYKQNYGRDWLNMGRDFDTYAKSKAHGADLFDLTAYHVLFGALFVGKQEYLFATEKKLAAVKKALMKYGDDELTRRACASLASGKYAPPGAMLRLGVRIMSRQLMKERYALLSAETAVLVALGLV